MQNLTTQRPRMQVGIQLPEVERFVAWPEVIAMAQRAEAVGFDALWLGDHLLYDKGRPLPFDAAVVSAFIKDNRDLTTRLVFTLGSAKATFYTCDLTVDYVRLNADYTT